MTAFIISVVVAVIVLIAGVVLLVKDTDDNGDLKTGWGIAGIGTGIISFFFLLAFVLNRIDNRLEVNRLLLDYQTVTQQVENFEHADLSSTSPAAVDINTIVRDLNERINIQRTYQSLWWTRYKAFPEAASLEPVFVDFNGGTGDE